jgi:hypothetical protein
MTHFSIFRLISLFRSMICALFAILTTNLGAIWGATGGDVCTGHTSYRPVTLNININIHINITDQLH